MTTLQLVTILITAVITTAAAQVIIWFKDHLIARRESRFSALYAALFFEKYASDCSDVLGELEAHISKEGHHGSVQRLPNLPEFPKEVEWRKLGIDLTQRAFVLRVDIDYKLEEIRDAASTISLMVASGPRRLHASN